MLFHLGALWRMNEAGFLPRLARISSVSGGSIVAGFLGLKWASLDFDANLVARRFVEEIANPLRGLAGHTIDVGSVLGGLVMPGSIGEKLAQAYRNHLFGTATLQDLPSDPPRFVINATNIQSGVLWRFMKPYMRDYRVGEVRNPSVQLAVAVAASSAYPPLLSPVCLELEPDLFTPGNEPLHREPYTRHVVLSDGGVYDNLGLETVWKRYGTVFVSDGGAQFEPDPQPACDWIRHSIRVNEIIDNQVRSLRKRQLIGALAVNARTGAYWSIQTKTEDLQPAVVLPCPHEKTLALARVPTRLRRLDEDVQGRIVNWGYAVCDAAIRRFYEPGLKLPAGFPYPGELG